MARIDQINEVLRKEVAQFIGNNIKMENGMITILDVDCSPELKNAKIYVSVLPDNQFGTALKMLKKNTSSLNSFLKRNVKLRKVPRIQWVIDPTEKEASVIERILNEIENEE
ncbi:MAG: 30S ribosome-binding factor RbfA [Patescibacteria group bacterium]|jgi:ribosome-binding factor A|nr:30S ribosome-binding factor RbfA [Patescibacteria group bacterium]